MGPEITGHRSPGRRIMLTFGGVAVGTVLIWAAFLWMLPGVKVPAADAADTASRLARILRLMPLPAGLLLLQVGTVAVARLITGAFDPLRDTEGRAQRIGQRVLSNTVEQTVIFVPALIGAAVLAGPGHLPMLVLAPGLFVAARLLFWAGYLIDPMYRAAGMAATLNINVGLVVFGAWRLVGAG